MNAKLTSIPPEEKCPKCKGNGISRLKAHAGMAADCTWCEGTGRRRQKKQPTAIAGTATARRIGEADSEAVVDGPAPLCDGLVKLNAVVIDMRREALREEKRHYGQTPGRGPEYYDGYNAALIELTFRLGSEAPLSPAQSAELSRRQ